MTNNMRNIFARYQLPCLIALLGFSAMWVTSRRLHQSYDAQLLEDIRQLAMAIKPESDDVLPSQITSISTTRPSQRIRTAVPLQRLGHLKSVSLNSAMIADLRAFREMAELETLNIRGCLLVTDLSDLQSVKKLVSLDIGNSSVANLTPLASDSNELDRLVADGLFIDLHPINRFAKLRCLCIEVLDNTPLRLPSSVEALTIKSRVSIPMATIPNCFTLRELRVLGMNGRIGELGDLPSLQSIFIYTKTINDIDSLGRYTNLEDVYLKGNLQESLSVFPALPRLQRLTIEVTDFNFMKDDVREFKKRCSDLNIELIGLNEPRNEQ